MEATHHCADRDVEYFGDLLVGKSVHVGQKHGDAEVLRQVVKGLLDGAVGEEVHQLVLGTASGPDCLETAEIPEQKEVLVLTHVGLVGAALTRAVLVDERVGEDAVEPRPQVGPLLEPVESPVAPKVGLLHQVLGVGGVARHAHGRRVQLSHERHRLFGEALLISHAVGGLLVGSRPGATRTGSGERWPSTHRVVGGFVGNGDVMRMALPNA